ncbi:MAG TPA: SMP-30/gluconolactonase/LRE family protein, partial [Thermoanaerobaculia bacterium]|nr:SMP-30/gluconolactonase/LRE family protein [Thermoanaerobaculia bacterium]
AQGPVTTFRDLSIADCHNPEGIAVAPNGTLFTAGLSGKICFVSASTAAFVRAPLAIPKQDNATPVNLLGELFVPDSTLFVADIGDFTGTKGRVLKVNPWTGSVRTLADGLAAPNAFALDRRGRLFVSDSFAGAIYTINTEAGGKTLWKKDALLGTAGDPPFGANGLAFDRSGRFLYVANTGDSRVLRIAVNRDGSAGAISVFADGVAINHAMGTTEALHGADGIAFDTRGNLWVCANQANEIQVLSRKGALIARFAGSTADPMDFPASPIFFGRSVFIANLALNHPGKGKISVLETAVRGAPLVPGDDGQGDDGNDGNGDN